MRFALNVSNMGDCSDPRVLVGLAQEAEASGWDAFLVWDSVHVPEIDPDKARTGDPWIALAAIATATDRILIGPIVTPLSRRRPWKVARETVTLDHLSNGRLVLPVGLGSLNDGGYSRVGEQLDRKTRARMLDESLAILDGLWSGKPFSFDGVHYQIEEMTFLPAPVQSPRIPVWVIAAWPSRTSMRRALRREGAMPIMRAENGEFLKNPSTADITEILAYTAAHRENATPLDIIIEASTPADDPEQAAAMVQPYADSGVTWWIESAWDAPGGLEGMRKRISQGPPTVR